MTVGSRGRRRSEKCDKAIIFISKVVGDGLGLLLLEVRVNLSITDPWGRQQGRLKWRPAFDSHHWVIMRCNIWRNKQQLMGNKIHNKRGGGQQKRSFAKKGSDNVFVPRRSRLFTCSLLMSFHKCSVFQNTDFSFVFTGRKSTLRNVVFWVFVTILF